MGRIRREMSPDDGFQMDLHMHDFPSPSSESVAAKSADSSVPSRAWRVAGIYAVFATLWIYFSDKALLRVIHDPELLVRVSVFKGLAFVAVTSVLLLLLMIRAFRTIEEGYASLLAEEQARKEQQVEIVRLNRLYAALSQVNQAIVWKQTREELFVKVCQVLVEFGGFRMAWIGWHNPENQRLEPVAECGDTHGCLKNIVVSVEDGPEGSGPSGTAFRTGSSKVCNDVLHDPVMLALREESIRRGLRSYAVIPIRLKGIPCGVLNVYADETDFFQDKEIALLEEAAVDVSFALDNLALEEEHKRAEEIAVRERHFSDMMIESLPGILYFYNDQRKFLRWNRNFETISGYSAEEIAGMHPLDFFATEDKRPLEGRIAEVFADGESSVEAPFLSKHGKSTPYFFTGRRVMFDGMSCLVGVGIDISARKKAEQALIDLNENLEHKVAQRTVELQSALVRAEASDRLKSAFLATMSHELRTPLNSIIGFTGIVLQELAGPLNEEQAKQLGMVRGSARHLLELINDILDLSKIEAGQLEIRCDPFDLPEALGHVVELVRPLAERKGLTLRYSIAPELASMTGDRRRLEQILLNLLNNAVKFTERGGVSLDVERSDDLNGAPAVHFKVRDTGIGIKGDDMVNLFRPFRQIDTGLSRQHEGTGLGLSICRRLAVLMGGEISVTSKWSVGSEFTVTIPSDLPVDPS